MLPRSTDPKLRAPAIGIGIQPIQNLVDKSLSKCSQTGPQLKSRRNTIQSLLIPIQKNCRLMDGDSIIV